MKRGEFRVDENEDVKKREQAEEEFKKKTQEFINAAYEMSVAWEMMQHWQTETEERANAAYPKCLPSFDEFLFDLFNLRDAVMNTEGWEVAK